MGSSQLRTAENLGNPLAPSVPSEQSNVRFDQAGGTSVF